MRSLIIATTALVGLSAAAPALAQADRYGGINTYAPPAAPQPQRQPGRVLTWGGKTIPTQAAPQNPYGAAPYAQPYPAQPHPAQAYPAQAAPPLRGAYPAQAAYPVQAPPQAYQGAPAQMAPPAQPYFGRQIAGAGQQPAQRAAPQPPVQASYPSPYQEQPYFAPAPMAVAPPQGSTATAPTGVYPTNTVPPQLAGPNVIPPQMAQPMVGAPQAPMPAPPTSIYAPPPQAMADPTDPRQNQRVAMNTAQPAASARYYSLHRQFGLQPDPTPPLPVDNAADAVQLVSSIDSGVGVEPAPENRTRVVQTTNGKTTTAVVRGARSDDAS